MPKRRRIATAETTETTETDPPAPSKLKLKSTKSATPLKDLDSHIDEILDGGLAEAASPDEDDGSKLSSPPPSSSSEDNLGNTKKKAVEATKKRGQMKKKKAAGNGDGDEEEYVEEKKTKKNTGSAVKSKKKEKAQGKKEEEENGEELEEAEERPPPVNSPYVPIPWKGRLGFACLNTYLRATNPPIFCSRTCRIDTILKHGKDGQKFVQSLGLANAKDLVKLIHWNEKYGIKFLRISSEMFPFASHPTYGYSLKFAQPVLAEAGKAAMKYGHRLSMHPGQFTQFGSPRKEVVENSIRDVEYHADLLGCLGLTGQADKDAVMILHMGGTFGDKSATLGRFRENYARLSPQVKARLVLENDDMCWSVHDLLPICKELNIPLVLDWHHHNLIRDPSMREGTLDILQLIPEIKETWTRKGITQKQHYSEPREGAIKHRDRRKHSPRVAVLPPCEDTMDLMIEAKDKEQAVFELMKKYKLDGWEKISGVIPHVRDDENKPEPKTRVVKPTKSKNSKKKKATEEDEGEEVEEAKGQVIPDDSGEPQLSTQLLPEEEIGMGGPEGRVYWPEGKEEWLSPLKRMRVKKDDNKNKNNEGREVNPSAGKGEEKAETKPKRKGRAVKTANDSVPLMKDEELADGTTLPPEGSLSKLKKQRSSKKKVDVEEKLVDEPPPPPPAYDPLPKAKRQRHSKKTDSDVPAIKEIISQPSPSSSLLQPAPAAVTPRGKKVLARENTTTKGPRRSNRAKKAVVGAVV